MASSITVTTTDLHSRGGVVTKYSIAWVSHSDGSVSNAMTLKAGELLMVKYVPDGGGTQPSDNYDFTILDANGIDILSGGGANLSQTNSTVAVPAISTYFKRFLDAGTYTVTGSNCGSAKGGTIVLYVH